MRSVPPRGSRRPMGRPALPPSGGRTRTRPRRARAAGAPPAGSWPTGSAVRAAGRWRGSPRPPRPRRRRAGPRVGWPGPAGGRRAPAAPTGRPAWPGRHGPPRPSGRPAGPPAGRRGHGTAGPVRPVRASGAVRPVMPIGPVGPDGPGRALEQDRALGHHQPDVQPARDLDGGVVAPVRDRVSPRLHLEPPPALAAGRDLGCVAVGAGHVSVIRASGCRPPSGPRSTTPAPSISWPSRKMVALTSKVSPATALAGRRPQSSTGCHIQDGYASDHL